MEGHGYTRHGGGEVESNGPMPLSTMESGSHTL